MNDLQAGDILERIEVTIAVQWLLRDIPKPPRGYWPKLAAGHKLPKRPALPK